MIITILTHHVNLSQVRDEDIRQHIALALGRFASRIRSVCVRLGDCNGPKGGVDIKGSAEISLVHGGKILLSGSDVSPESATARLIDRAKTAIARSLDRGRVRGRRLLVDQHVMR